MSWREPGPSSGADAGAAAGVAAVADRLAAVRDELAAAGGDPDAITIVAVTKGFGPDVALAAAAAGLGDLAENYAQELRAKADVVPGARWHFIGRLQTNKVRGLAGRVHLWQTIDRPELVDELARRAPGTALLVQVDAAGTLGKGGCDPAAAPDLVGRARDAGLDPRGLMAVGVAGDPAATAAAFTATARLADRLDLPVRSLGMSGDLAEAVRAGTTMIRVGRGLFGPRPARADPRRSATSVRD